MKTQLYCLQHVPSVVWSWVVYRVALGLGVMMRGGRWLCTWGCKRGKEPTVGINTCLLVMGPSLRLLGDLSHYFFSPKTWFLYSPVFPETLCRPGVEDNITSHQPTLCLPS